MAQATCFAHSPMSSQNGTVEVRIEEHENLLHLHGGKTWAAAKAMSLHLQQSKKWSHFKGTTLELGSGTGLVGLTVAVVGGGHVILTDKQPLVVAALTETIAINQLDSCEASVLDWDECNKEIQQKSFDLIIVADCMYSQSVTGSMCDALSAYHGAKTKVFFGYEQRWSSPECLDVLADKGWRFEEEKAVSTKGAEVHIGELVRI